MTQIRWCLDGIYFIYCACICVCGCMVRLYFYNNTVNLVKSLTVLLQSSQSESDGATFKKLGLLLVIFNANCPALGHNINVLFYCFPIISPCLYVTIKLACLYISASIMPLCTICSLIQRMVQLLHWHLKLWCLFTPKRKNPWTYSMSNGRLCPTGMGTCQPAAEVEYLTPHC